MFDSKFGGGDASAGKLYSIELFLEVVNNFQMVNLIQMTLISSHVFVASKGLIFINQSDP